MIAGPPFRPGRVQRADRLVVEPRTGDSRGCAGRADCSKTSVSRIVTASVALSVPSDAFTRTEYELFAS